MELRWSDIPGLREAVKREADVRDASFLDLTSSVCGVEIRQMTLRDFIVFDGIGSPLLFGGLPHALQIVDFLWRLSPNYKRKSWLRRYLFARKVRDVIRNDFRGSVAACRKYVHESLQDLPAGGGPSRILYAGWCAYIINTIAINYGWSEEKILTTPLKRLFQYLRCIRRYHDSNCPMRNPSDDLKLNHLRLLNARQQLVNTLKRRTLN